MILCLFGASGNAAPHRNKLYWPKKPGVYVAQSRDKAPAFPRALRQYRSESNKDFWGKDFECKGSIRVFEGAEWTGIPNFPATMNGCGSGLFMIRWRSAHPGITIASTLGFYNSRISLSPKKGTFGYMFGDNCEQPMFKFASNHKRNSST